MFTNFYEKLKAFIKRNYKNIILFLVLYLFFVYPLKYYIIIGGGIMPVGNRIEVEDSYSLKGSLNLAYVSQIRATISTYFLSYIIPDWKRVKVSEYTYDDSENLEDIEFRGEIDLLNSNRFAIKNAYQEANKSYQVISTKLYVYVIDSHSHNEFKIGDQILKVDGVAIHSTDEYKKVISNHQAGDQLKVLVKRKKKEKEVKVTLYEKDGNILSGIYITSLDEYKTNPKIKIQFKKSESGPSGGLIEALDIYNKLTKEDITKGKKIAGTGEIDSEGNILSIGEVKYKLLGAVSKDADVFIVPKGENLKTCMKVKKEKHLDIQIIGVSTFKEAIEKLKESTI